MNLDRFSLNRCLKIIFSIFHINISSLQGNFDKLELLLSQVEDVHNFDVILMSNMES